MPTQTVGPCVSREANIRQTDTSLRRDTTRLLEAWSNGDTAALEPLMTRVYGELQTLAAGYLRRERSGHTLRTSALVHEAYLRLLEQQHLDWRSRAHFMAIAAKMMRRVLLNHSRERQATKRGSGSLQVPLEDSFQIDVQRPEQFIHLDEALNRLAKARPEQARIVEMRFFGGLSQEEIAEVMAVSVPTVARRWRLARAWLYRALCENP